MTATQVMTRFFKEQGLGWLGFIVLREAFKDYKKVYFSSGKIPTIFYSKSFPTENENKILVDIMLKCNGSNLESAFKIIFSRSKTLRIKGGYALHKKYYEFLRTRVKKNYRKKFIPDTYKEIEKWIDGSKCRNGYHKIDFTLVKNDTCI